MLGTIKKIVEKTHYTVQRQMEGFSKLWSEDGGFLHVRFVAFVTILLNRPFLSRRFIYFKASFSCKKHQGKTYKTQRILVANLATNFWILVASTIILVALATVLGAISCPVNSSWILLFITIVSFNSPGFTVTVWKEQTRIWSFKLALIKGLPLKCHLLVLRPL